MEKLDKELELKLVHEGKFCVSCEHIATTGSRDPATYRCFAPQNLDSQTLNVVTGQYERHWKYSSAILARHAPNRPDEGKACGLEGKWWEAKKEPPPLRAESDRSINKTSKKISADDL